MKKLILILCLGAGQLLAQTATPPASLQNWATANSAIAVPDPTTTGQGMLWDNSNHKWISGSVAGGSSPNLWQTIRVAGQTDLVANTTTDILTLAAGTGITLTTTPASDTVTITSTAGGGGTVTTTGSPTTGVIAAFSGATSITNASMATASVIYRKTTGTGVPEVQTLATLKTDLGLTGSNSGDQVVPANTGATTSQWFNAYNSTTGAFSATQPAESDLSFTNITTNNATTSKHGFLPILDANSAHFLNGNGGWTTPAAGTLTNVANSLPTNAVVLGNTYPDTKAVAGITTDGTAVLNLGVANTTLGQIQFFNATSGNLFLRPVSTALGTNNVMNIPTEANGTLASQAWVTSNAMTLTNKRIDPRTAISATNNTAPTPDVSAADEYIATAMTVNMVFGAPTGSPVQGTKLIIRIKDDNTTPRTIGWNATYKPIGVTLPTTTALNKLIYVGCIYNATVPQWDVVAVSSEQ